MKITVIGQWGGFPKVGESTSGYLIEYNGFNLLLECGSGVISSIQKIIDLKNIDAVLISHYHYDHFCDIGPLQYGRLVKSQLGQLNTVLPIYAPNDEIYFKTLTMEPYTLGYAYNETSILTIGPFTVNFSKNTHPVDSYSMRICCDGKIFGYTSDTSYTQTSDNFFDNCNVLLCECSFYDNMDGTEAGHLNSAQAGTLAEKSNAKSLVLTHLPHFGDTDNLTVQAAKHYKGQIVLAKQFMEINI